MDDAAVRAAASYMVVSVGMVVANKEAVRRVEAGTLLLAIQQAATIAATLGLHKLGIADIRGEWRDVFRWVPIGILSGLLLWTGMQAVKYASLSTLTVIRNASPLFLLVAERVMFGVAVTRSMVASLSMILLGVVVYAADELYTQAALGMAFVLLDAAMVCVDRLAERYLLQQRTISLSTSALVLVSNIVGLWCSVALLSWPMRSEWDVARWPAAGIAWAAASCVGGTAIAYAGIRLSQKLSATGALVVANVDKVLVMSYGIIVLGDGLDFMKFCGCMLALLGGAWHAWARLQVTDASSRLPAATCQVALMGQSESHEAPAAIH